MKPVFSFAILSATASAIPNHVQIRNQGPFLFGRAAQTGNRSSTSSTVGSASASMAAMMPNSSIAALSSIQNINDTAVAATASLTSGIADATQSTGAVTASPFIPGPSQANGTAAVSTTAHASESTGKVNNTGAAGTGSPSKSGCDVFLSRTITTTICAATSSATPSGYVKLPSGPGAPGWTQAPSGDCALGASASVLTQCWKDLDLADYVTWWYQNFNHTCSGLGFGDCFYAQMTKYAPSNCTQTGPDQPCQQPTFSDFQNTWNGARNFYIAWNIWNMGSFFSKYWIAVGDSAGIASGGIANITAAINPVQSTNVGFNAMMVALASSLALAVPGLDALVPVTGKVVAGMLFGAAQQVPTVSRFLIPESSTTEQQFLDFSNFDASLSKMTDAYQNNIANALPGLLNNLTNFKTAANTGSFSAQQPDTNDLKNQILPGLYTFVTSQIYQAKGVTLLRTPNTDVHELASNGTPLAWNTNCGSGYNGVNSCGEFYFSKQNKTTYALTDPQNDQTHFASAWTTVFNGFTSGDLLFAGADECAQLMKNNTVAHQVNIGNIADGPSAVKCLSSLPVCTWNTVYTSNGNDLSTDCAYGHDGDPLGRWVGNTGGDVAVPTQYLGYGIINSNELKDSKITFDTNPCGSNGNCD